MKCKHCNREIPDDAKFCSFCGQPVSDSESKICPHCQKKYDAEQVYCSECGNRLVLATSQAASPAIKHQTSTIAPMTTVVARQSISSAVSVAGQSISSTTSVAGQPGSSMTSVAGQPISSTASVASQTKTNTTRTAAAGHNHFSSSQDVIITINMMSKYEGTPKVGVAKATGKLKFYPDRIEYEKQFGNSMGNAFGLAGMLVSRNQMKKEGNLETYYMKDIVEVKKGEYMVAWPALVLKLRDGKTVSFAGTVSGNTIENAVNFVKRKIVK